MSTLNSDKVLQVLGWWNGYDWCIKFNGIGMHRELKKIGCACERALTKLGHSGVKKIQTEPLKLSLPESRQTRAGAGCRRSITGRDIVVGCSWCALTMSGGNDGKKMKTGLSELGVCGNCQMRVGRVMGGSFEGSIWRRHKDLACGWCMHSCVCEGGEIVYPSTIRSTGAQCCQGGD